MIMMDSKKNMKTLWVSKSPNTSKTVKSRLGITQTLFRQMNKMEVMSMIFLEDQERLSKKEMIL